MEPHNDLGKKSRLAVGGGVELQNTTLKYFGRFGEFSFAL